MKRLDLLQEIVGQPLPRDDGQAGNVIDRLLRIKFGALPPCARQDIDQMRADVEQPKFENRKKSRWAGSDDDNVGFDHLAHLLSFTAKPDRPAAWERGNVAIREYKAGLRPRRSAPCSIVFIGRRNSE